MREREREREIKRGYGVLWHEGNKKSRANEKKKEMKWKWKKNQMQIHNKNKWIMQQEELLKKKVWKNIRQ